MSAGERSERASIAVLCALALVCLAAFAQNLGLPLVRNGFVYARAAENVIAHGYDARPVVADSLLSYDKPIGFAWLAAPLVAMFGNHTGLRIASLLGTLAYLVAAWSFVRTFAPADLGSRTRAWALCFGTLSPLCVYQSWSAHPDSLFAALYLSACIIAQRIVDRPSPARVALWSAIVLLALLLKNYGMVLVPSTGLYFLWNVRRMWQLAERRRGAIVVILAFLVVGGVIALGWTPHNPWMRFRGEGGGVGQIGKGDSWRMIGGTLAALAVAVLVNLQIALLPLFFRKSLDARLVRLVGSFPVPYVIGLFFFPNTFYNMRYFLPVFPFVALSAAIALQRCAPVVRTAIPAAFVLVAACSVAVFNVEWVYTRVEHWLPRWEVNWAGPPLSFFDNLRMPAHLDERAWITNLNQHVDPDGVVYMVDVFYYRDARQGVLERAGLIRGDVRTRYVRSDKLAPTEARYWVQGPLRDPSVLQKLGSVTDQGFGLYLVEAESSGQATER